MAIALAPHRDPRLMAFGTCAALAIIAAIIRSNPALVVAVAVFALPLFRSHGEQPQVQCSVTVGTVAHTYLIGDEVTFPLTIRVPEGMNTWAQVRLTSSWVAADDAELQWELPAGTTSAEVSLAASPTTWGNLRLGVMHFEARRATGMVVWTVDVPLESITKVLPHPAHVRTLLPPPASRVVNGAHISGGIGDGFDFADVRAYSPGDRLRDVNWSATARSSEVQVNRRHPERSGDVIVMVDTFIDKARSSQLSLDAMSRVAQAAWAIADLHLGAQDRVGLSTRGPVLRSLKAGGGDRNRYRLLNALLDTGADIADGTSSSASHGAKLPHGALIVAVTTMTDAQFMSELLLLKAEGRQIVVIVVDIADLVAGGDSVFTAGTHRLFQIGLEQTRVRLDSTGIPMALWSKDAPLGAVVAVLKHLRRTKVVRR